MSWLDLTCFGPHVISLFVLNNVHACHRYLLINNWISLHVLISDKYPHPSNASVRMARVTSLHFVHGTEFRADLRVVWCQVATAELCCWSGTKLTLWCIAADQVPSWHCGALLLIRLAIFLGVSRCWWRANQSRRLFASFQADDVFA